MRYAVKRQHFDDAAIRVKYLDASHEEEVGALPTFGGSASTGLTKNLGWLLQAYIEDASGVLRLQTRQEQMFCLGCHSTIGVTVDQSFSLPRKLPGAAGWGHQDLAGMADVPQAGSREPEIQRYFERVGGGDEFRANDEILRRFFQRGVLDRAAVRRAAPGGDRDIRDLLVPSRARALQLDKAYMSIVAEQSFALGRDAVTEALRNVHQRLDDSISTALKAMAVFIATAACGRTGADGGEGDMASVKQFTARR